MVNLQKGNIKVSIITPTYNDERYIERTLHSIFNQTFQNFEVVIVDDHSTDSTVEIINRFNDSRIKLFVNDQNRGAAYSRNLALRNASGDYIAFLDGDDQWLPDKLEKQLSFMLTNNYVFSYTKYGVINENENFIGKVLTGPQVVTHRKFRRVDYVGCLTVMFKKDIYPNLSIPDDIYKRNDYALWLKLSERADCYLLNEMLSIYTGRRSGSVSNISKIRLLKYHKLVFSKIYGYGRIRSSLCAYRNAFFYILKVKKYTTKRTK